MPRGIVKAGLAAIVLPVGLVAMAACGVSPSGVAGPTSPIRSATVTATTLGIRPAVTATMTTVRPTAAVLMTTPVSQSTAVLVPPPVGTGTPVPALSPTPSIPTTVEAERTITLEDNGKTVAIPWGRRFLLALDPALNWTVTVANPGVVSRLDVPAPAGTQGYYEAKLPEQTKITAEGDPPCRKSQPPCLAPSRLFEVEIVVEYAK